MGIIYSNAALLLRAREAGARFDRTLTIGHQQWYVSPSQWDRLAGRFRMSLDPAVLKNQAYADPFFQALGACELESLDISDFEGSELIHDLNHPIPDSLAGQFDAVIDGGSLEHVFNFPVAIQNYMTLVRPGGNLFLFTMANNHCGHGFYQFSPELFFRILTPENGFAIQELILELHDYPGAELSERTRCYSVRDPATVGQRVGLVSSGPVMMMVQAVRTEHRPVLEDGPIQSDYAVRHEASESAGTHRSRWRDWARRVKQRLPRRIQNAVDGWRQLRHYSIRNPAFYRPWDPLGPGEGSQRASPITRSK